MWSATPTALRDVASFERVIERRQGPEVSRVIELGRPGNQAICAICGRRPATTRDHVPPKGIFPRPRPGNLITIPACKPCNNAASADDEVFRLYLALHVADLNDPVARAYFEEALRTYRHNERLRREVMESAEPVEYVGPDGQPAGQGLRVLWNSTAHDAIIERTVRGLYYFHFAAILSCDVRVAPKWFRERNSALEDAFANCNRHVIGNDQFCYWYQRDEDRPELSTWLFEFYGRHWAGAHTGMPEQGRHPQGEGAT